jgi:hypothetical protein
MIFSQNSILTSDRSVILGGQNITGTTNDTVYVPNLSILGSLSKNSTTVDASIDPNLLSTDSVVFFNASIPGGTIYLPLPVLGKEIILIRYATTNSASVAPAFPATINGLATKPLSTTLYTMTRIISDGTNWYANESTPL